MEVVICQIYFWCFKGIYNNLAMIKDGGKYGMYTYRPSLLLSNDDACDALANCSNNVVHSGGYQWTLKNRFRFNIALKMSAQILYLLLNDNNNISKYNFSFGFFHSAHVYGHVRCTYLSCSFRWVNNIIYKKKRVF